MDARTHFAAAAACALLASATAAEEATLLRPGIYEVVVNLDLPHLEGMGASKTATICVEEAGRNPTRGLVVLSENNPLGRCPASNVRSEGHDFKFEVHCAGKNAAEGFASYLLQPDSFDGRIDMKMGGKNMTMSETQKGKRVGACPAPDKPKS